MKRKNNTMCVALPGTVIEVKDRKAVVDFSGNRVNARAGLVDVKPGDQVLVHAGCIIQKVSMEEGEEMKELFGELEALAE
jgi:hydrogenase expression/formation protein HypC